MQFFEVRIKYDAVGIDGSREKKTETYALQVLSFTEAEARITSHMEPYVNGDFEVCAIKKANYGEVKYHGGGRYYLVKYNLVTIDEISGKERKHAVHVLFEAPDIDKAKEHAHGHMSGTLLDYEIVFIKETDIVDALLFDGGQG